MDTSEQCKARKWERTTKRSNQWFAGAVLGIYLLTFITQIMRQHIEHRGVRKYVWWYRQLGQQPVTDSERRI